MTGHVGLKHDETEGGLLACAGGYGRAGGAEILAMQFLDRLVDFAPLGFQLLDLGEDKFGVHGELFAKFLVRNVDEGRDLCQREAEALALEDHLQSNAIRRGVMAGPPRAARDEKSAALVEAEGSEAEPEFAREIADRVRTLRRRLCNRGS